MQVAVQNGGNGARTERLVFCHDAVVSQPLEPASTVCLTVEVSPVATFPVVESAECQGVTPRT